MFYNPHELTRLQFVGWAERQRSPTYMQTTRILEIADWININLINAEDPDNFPAILRGFFSRHFYYHSKF